MLSALLRRLRGWFGPVPRHHKVVISLSRYFEPFGPPPDDIRDRALILLARVNALLGDIPLADAQDPEITSGWRPAYYNRTIPNAAKNSKHITGEAVDIADADGVLDDYLLDHPELLERHGLWMEHPSATKGWVHLQSVPPPSGRRAFYP